MSNKLKEKLLVALVKRNDPEAFAVIYNEYVKKIYRYVYFRVASREITQDLTQDTFTRLLVYLKNSERSIDNLQALIYQIARSVVAAHYTEREKMFLVELPQEKRGEEYTTEELPADVDLEVDFDQQIIKEKMAGYINKIVNDDYREIVTLRFVEQMDFDEIAQIMEKDVATLRVVLHRALQQLKKKILEDGGVKTLKH
jgi:RNA polymerase sigma-70 factor, ECF subfamily